VVVDRRGNVTLPAVDAAAVAAAAVLSIGSEAMGVGRAGMLLGLGGCCLVGIPGGVL
jgi:hypothetical protein